MTYGFLDIAVTPSVHAAQVAMGTDHLWEGDIDRAFDRFTEREAAFIAARDSFYMATVSETGWPYVQDRGGAPGFVKLIDDRTLAFPDFRGNRQYLSIGNLAADDRVCLIMVDYAHRARLKIYAHVELVSLDADPALTELVIDPRYRAKVERIMKLRLEAFDRNCPQHITPRFTGAEMAEFMQPLQERVAELETENARLQAQLIAAGGAERF